MDTVYQQYLSAMKRMKEDELTRKILKPLFEAMGYDRVDFNGGPYERGRDLIAQIRIPPRKENHVVYIQTKKIGDIQNTSDSAKFTQLAHQLRQCCTEPVTTIDGDELKANEVFIACPEEMSSRFLSEIKGCLDENSPVKPLDGIKIIDCIKEYKIDLLRLLSDIDETWLGHNNEDLINKELFSALHTKKNISLAQFYSDLSFFVGSVDSNYLLHLNATIQESKVALNESEWKVVKPLIDSVYKKHSIKLLIEETETIERDFSINNEKFLSAENRANIKELTQTAETYERLTVNAERELKSLLTTLEEGKSLSGNKKEYARGSPITDGLSEDEIEELIEINNSLLGVIHSDLNYVLEPVGGSSKKAAFYASARSIIESIEEIKKLKTKISALEKLIVNAPLYTITLSKDEIIGRIKKSTDDYIRSVASINSGKTNPTAIKKFILETEKSLSFIGALKESNTPLSNHVKFEHNQRKDDRISLSPHDIFSTGHDIAVYGGAGVGKTTTLQAYVEFFSELDNKSIVYIPLNRLFNKFKEYSNEKSDVDARKDLVHKLILILKNQIPTDENIQKLDSILRMPLTLILDGLDEVYTTMQYIIEEISIFKKRYAHIQLIISSRDCVSYLSEIDFLGITLLPFTNEQLDKFIAGWIDDKTKADNLIASIRSQNLYEHIKTPLLATITCTLVEKGINAPASEYHIYFERIRLLTGDYDAHKNVDRQKQSPELLKECARKLAFEMQNENIRSIEPNKILPILRNCFAGRYSDKLLVSCIRELEDPCNVLVRDKLNSSLSFGHFRFQEHLAAWELSQNRSIDLPQLTIYDWWIGTLGLYAQVNDFDHLFEDIFSKYGNISRSSTALNAMIKSAPKSRKSRLNEIFTMYKKSDKQEFGIFGKSKYDSYSYDFDDPFEY